MDKGLVPIILCGGAGTRLWPLSVPSHPKPFHHFVGEGTLYQQTLLRASALPFSKPPLVVALVRNAALALAQAEEVGVSIDLILEKEGRDTCLAILAGVIAAEAIHGSTQVAVLAADHAIPDHGEFRAAFAQAMASVDAASLILFGIAPNGPRTEFGYVVPGPAVAMREVAPVLRFIEKPDREHAAALIVQGALWNSGNFIGSTMVFLQQARLHAPDYLDAAHGAFNAGHGEGNVRYIGSYGEGLSPKSFDRAIVEKSEIVRVLQCDFAWSDLGTWDDVQRITAPGGNLIRVTGQTTRVIGLEDVIVVSTPEGLLVTRAGQSNALKAELTKAKCNAFGSVE